jgi:polysaccharide pyruvyl transferase WcaK-like protein
LDEAVELIATSSALVTARLHGGIIAATQGTPVALIDYQDKIRGLAKLLDRPAYSLAQIEGCTEVVDEALTNGGSRSPSPAAAYGDLTRRFLRQLADES